MSCKANYNNMQMSVMKGAGSAIKKILSQKGGKKNKKGGVSSSFMVKLYLLTLMAVAVMCQYGIIPSIQDAASAVLEAAGPEAKQLYSMDAFSRFIENFYIFIAYSNVDPASRPAFCSDTRGTTTALGFWAEGFDNFDKTCAKGTEATGIFITGAVLAMLSTFALAAGISLNAFTNRKKPTQTAEIGTQANDIQGTEAYLTAARNTLNEDITDVNAIRDLARHTQALMAAVSSSDGFNASVEALADQLSGPEIEVLPDNTLTRQEPSSMVVQSSQGTLVAQPSSASSMFSCLQVPPPNMLSGPNRNLLASAAESRMNDRLSAITGSEDMIRTGGKRRRNKRKKTKKNKRRQKKRQTKRR